jgi:hypothetical protein
MKSLISALSILLISTLSGQQRPDFYTATFDELVDAVAGLRIDKDSPQMIPVACKGGVPASSVVYTEGDGNLYLLIFRGSLIAQVGSWERFEEDQGKLYDDAGIKPELRPVIDRANRRIEYFSEAVWKRIIEAMSDHPAMEQKFIDGFVARTKAQNAPEVAYLIPAKEEKRLLESLILKGWGIKPVETRFFMPPKQ